ncbi:MAG: sialate O-acetylesterase [Planctomycetaceae bacterium]|nr:sialate O-acetylesterase [Planctomycetaceae bacterium]
MAKRPKDIDVWVLAGQSNMQGCGWLDGCEQPDERVWNFTSAGKWEVAAEPLHRFWESFTPVHYEMIRPWVAPHQKKMTNKQLAEEEDRNRKSGAGLGMSFGKAMADALGRPIGLIACAHGGTSLDQWSPALKNKGGHSLYGAMLQRIAKAGGNLRGILWYQGCSDATSADQARTYADRFDAWIAAVRKDLKMPRLPVVAVQIGRVLESPGREGNWHSWDLVREALGTLPRRVPHTAVTTSVDLSMADIIHIDTPGLIRLGKRMARLALKLTELPNIAGGPVVKRIEPMVTAVGGRNALRLRFDGVSGGWSVRHNIPGFVVRFPRPELRNPVIVVEAAAHDDDSISLLLSREPESDVQVAYGLGIQPVCTLTDKADMPLCSFLAKAAAKTRKK